jgi:hypothetical protein
MLLTTFGNKIKSKLAVTAAALLVMGAVQSAQAAHVKIGSLECKVAPGVGLIIVSSKPMTCTFKPSSGKPEQYVGHVRKFGLDIGVTAGTVILWAVFAAQKGHRPGLLAGRYAGVSAEASVGLGVGANALVGGSNKSIALQPLSVQGQAGLDIAIAMTAIDLEPR